MTPPSRYATPYGPSTPRLPNCSFAKSYCFQNRSSQPAGSWVRGWIRCRVEAADADETVPSSSID
jgi:hypothetical protein